MTATAIQTSMTNKTESTALTTFVTANGKPSRLITSIIEYVMVNFAEEITLEDLSNAASMSRFNLCRRFQQECGVTPMRWLWAFRTLLAAEFMTLDPYWSLTDVAFSCGFTSSAHFSRSFKQQFKMSPSAYRKTKQATTAQVAGQTRGQSFDSLFVHNQSVILRAADAALAAGA